MNVLKRYFKKKENLEICHILCLWLGVLRTNTQKPNPSILLHDDLPSCTTARKTQTLLSKNWKRTTVHLVFDPVSASLLCKDIYFILFYFICLIYICICSEAISGGPDIAYSCSGCGSMKKMADDGLCSFNFYFIYLLLLRPTWKGMFQSCTSKVDKLTEQKYLGAGRKTTKNGINVNNGLFLLFFPTLSWSWSSQQHYHIAQPGFQSTSYVWFIYIRMECRNSFLFFP